MAILKSEIVGVTISTLLLNRIKDIPGSNKPHGEWKSLPTKHLDFISKCTLRYVNSYGAKYKIDPNHELMIKHTTNGKSYPLESYKRLLDMVVTDYDDSTQSSQEQPMYLDREPIVGDYVECIISSGTPMYEGSVWKVTYIYSDGSIALDGADYYWTAANFKVINPEHQYHPEYKEQPMPTSQEIKVGSHWERINYLNFNSPDGEIVTVEEITGKVVHFNGNRDRSIREFLERFKPRPDLDTITSTPTDKRNLAFYKESGEPWTEEELDTVRNYCGDTSSRYGMLSSITKRKYAYWDENSQGSLKVYLWEDQNKPKQLEQISYESVFTVATPIKKQTAKPKSKPVAQPEPIQSITRETFMSKLKAVASTTVDQNKQALVIASKMEAGRIINKQVLKQLKPHLPFFLQGYASSPFAPFVAANLVAMVANHTGNSKLTKVSDLMLLGAADSGVAAFNLDKIVDDILSNIKLPAGILDDSEE